MIETTSKLLALMLALVLLVIQHLVTANSNSTGNNQVGAQPPSATTAKPNYLETGRQITGILDRFMSLGYDKRVRPNYGGPPVEVNVTMRILSISSVSEVMMDFTADFYFRQTWHDPRLSFKKLGDIQTLYVGAEVSKKIWLPDTFFGNEKLAYFHEATTPNVFLRIDHSGEVYRSIRQLSEMNPSTELMMKYGCFRPYFGADGYNVKDIIYRWARKDTAVERDKEISLPQFDIVKTVQKYRLEELSSGTYSRLIAEIHFARRMGYYLIQIYIPSSLIVVISWVSFWLHRNASPARVQLGVTTVLTMTTLMSSTNAALPKISYVKSIDIFLGTCFVMVFAALLEYATVGYLGKRIAMRKAHVQHAQARIFAHLQANQGTQAAPDQSAANAAAATSLGIFGSEPITSASQSAAAMQAAQPSPLIPGTAGMDPNLQGNFWEQLIAAAAAVSNTPNAALNQTQQTPRGQGTSKGLAAESAPMPPNRSLPGRRCQCCHHSSHHSSTFGSRLSSARDDDYPCDRHAVPESPLACNCQHQRLIKRLQSARPSRSLNTCRCGTSMSSATMPRNMSLGASPGADTKQTSGGCSKCTGPDPNVQPYIQQQQQQLSQQPPSYPNKGTSAAATAAAAAAFVNMHRRNKGLPPSDNPNFAQFTWFGSPNRSLETIFGVRPSDIDKYSRVIFPVCFVCFQLMYWIVYLHISAFLESELQPPPPS